QTREFNRKFLWTSSPSFGIRSALSTTRKASRRPNRQGDGVAVVIRLPTWEGIYARTGRSNHGCPGTRTGVARCPCPGSGRRRFTLIAAREAFLVVQLVEQKGSAGTKESRRCRIAAASPCSTGPRNSAES